MTPEEIIDQIQEVRKKNNALWMDLLRLALKASPKEAKEILAKITANDRKVSDLTGRLTEGE